MWSYGRGWMHLRYSRGREKGGYIRRWRLGMYRMEAWEVQKGVGVWEVQEGNEVWEVQGLKEA